MLQLYYTQWHSGQTPAPASKPGLPMIRLTRHGLTISTCLGITHAAPGPRSSESATRSCQEPVFAPIPFHEMGGAGSGTTLHCMCFAWLYRTLQQPDLYISKVVSGTELTQKVSGLGHGWIPLFLCRFLTGSNANRDTEC